MGNRAMKRQMARHMMELAGIRRINEKKSSLDMETGKVVKASYFATHWKAYMDPDSDERKALHAKLMHKAAMEMQKQGARKQGARKQGKVLRVRPWPCGRFIMEVKHR